jgi:putative Mn2+ efflux pump MntP
METLILFGILTGLDNLQVSSALGLMNVRAMRKNFIALIFGLYEALMPLLGLTIGYLIHLELGTAADKIGSIILASCGLVIIIETLKGKDARRILDKRWFLVALPLTLSLDNLFAGLGFGVLGYPILFSALIIGMISSAMCFIGLYLGSWVRRFIPKKVEIISGAYLMLMATIMFFADIG